VTETVDSLEDGEDEPAISKQPTGTQGSSDTTHSVHDVLHPQPISCALLIVR